VPSFSQRETPFVRPRLLLRQRTRARGRRPRLRYGLRLPHLRHRKARRHQHVRAPGLAQAFRREVGQHVRHPRHPEPPALPSPCAPHPRCIAGRARPSANRPTA
jgi:hypothetical protein